jgi:hypothetical protein
MKSRKKNSKKDYRTFDEWKNYGRHVIKGEKSKKRNKDGVAVFEINQTDKSVYFVSDNKGNEDGFGEYMDNEIFKDNWLFT